VVFVDADVEVHPDTLDRVRAVLDTRPDVHAVFGSYDDRPADPGVVSTFRNLLHHHVHHVSAGPAETFWTGLGAVRGTVFEAVGGFDDSRYPLPSIEDIEFGRRLRTQGYSVVLDPSILGTHLKAWSLRTMLWTDFARRGVPWVALQVRERRLSKALNCGWRHRASAALALSVVAVAAFAPLLAAAPAAALVWLNRSFYALLYRHTGPQRAAAGVVLHLLHHLVSVAAVPIGAAAALVKDRSLRPRDRAGRSIRPT
jgi:GT2 family glycosyltransferase